MSITSVQVMTYAKALGCIRSNAAPRWSSFDDDGELRGRLRNLSPSHGTTIRLTAAGDLSTAWVRITRDQAQGGGDVWVLFSSLVSAAQGGEAAIVGYA